MQKIKIGTQEYTVLRVNKLWRASCHYLFKQHAGKYIWHLEDDKGLKRLLVTDNLEVEEPFDDCVDE